MRIYAASYLVPVSSPPIAGGGMAVDRGRIVAVGKLADIRARFDGDVDEFPGCVITPGLVNAHTHLELTHFPSWRLRRDMDYSPRTYVDWVIQVIKTRRTVSEEELSQSVSDGIRKSLAAGTTAMGDIVSDASQLHLYGSSSLAGRLFFEAIGQDPVTTAQQSRSLEHTLSAFQAGQFLPGLSPHAPHTLSPDFARSVQRLAVANDLPRMIHLSESPEEVIFMHDSSGAIAELLYPLVHWEQFLPHPMKATSASYLNDLGILDRNTIAVHCVHVTPSDAELLSKNGVQAVICPRSNDKLAVGKPPLQLLKKVGIPMAIGTDSLASNDSLSLWDEMRYLLESDFSPFTPEELFYMATLGGGEVLGIEGEIGSLTPGKRADFLVVETIAPDAASIFEAIVTSGRLRNVFTAGEPAIKE